MREVPGEAEDGMLVDPCGSQGGMNGIINKKERLETRAQQGAPEARSPQPGGAIRGGGSREGGEVEQEDRK